MINSQLLDDGILSIIDASGNESKLKLRSGQLEAIKKIDEKPLSNLLFIAPTAYGKTIPAEHYAIQTINNGLKVIYCSPLKALTAEMVETFQKVGLKVLEDTGDFRKKPLEDYNKCDILIITYERLDSVIRNSRYHPAFEQFGLVIIDEIHTIHSDSRGVNLESLIVKIKEHTSMAILGMSATVDNYELLADFIGADYVYVPPEQRPVKQNIEIHYYNDDNRYASMMERNYVLHPILNDLLARDKQALIFCSSRQRCEQLAHDFSGINTRNPVDMAKKSNYTWHHAGVSFYDKKTIENMFRKDEVKFIFCTPTLAMGVNLPAFCVVIYDNCRYSGLMSMDVLIDSMEIEQMIGRAGRPQFGEKICDIHIFARHRDNPYEIEESIICSKLLSQLTGVMNEWIVSGMTEPSEISDSLNNTFLSRQRNINSPEIKEQIQNAMSFLLTNHFIYLNDGSFSPSFLGKMTALFYIKPETALHFKKVENEYQNKMEQGMKISDLELISAILNTEEFLDLVRVSDGEVDYKLIDLASKEFQSLAIPNKLWNEKIMKVIPMIFKNYFEKKYNCLITVYRTDANTLEKMLERFLSSASVIIFNKDIKKRLDNLRVMIKTKTLDKGIAILNGTKGLGATRLGRLIKAGINTPEMFLRTNDVNLMKIMNVSNKVLVDIKSDMKLKLRELN